MTDITIYISRPPAGPRRYSFDPPPAFSAAHRIVPPDGWRWHGTGSGRLIRTPSGELAAPYRALALARRGLAGFRLGDPAAPVAELERRPVPEGWDSDAGLAPMGEVF